MKTRTQALLLLHLTVIIWGFTGVLGKLISLQAEELVWCRTLIAVVGLVIASRFLHFPIGYPQGRFAEYMFTGLVIAVHWITFFAAIKASTVSVTLACLASTTAFVSFLEPLIYRRPIRAYEVIIGLIVFASLGLIFQLESRYHEGIVLATISAFGAALFTVLNGRQVEKDRPLRIATYELFGAWACVSVYLLASGRLNVIEWSITRSDIIWLLVLGLLCTSFAFSVGVAVMKQLSPFTVALTVNMEPVYGILLALLFFGETEHLHPGTYLAGIVILSCLFYNGWRQRRSMMFHKKE